MEERYLIIQTAFIGDAVLTLPMIEKLKETNRNALIDVIAIPGTAEIFRNSPFVNEVLVFEKRRKHKSLLGIYSFARILRERGYRKIYSPHRSFRTSLLVLLTGLKDTFGFDTASMSFIYGTKIKYQSAYHEVRRLLEIISYPTDETSWKIIPAVKTNGEAVKKAEELLDGFTGNVIAIAPGSVWETKKYPQQSYRRLIELITEAGFSCVLVGGKEDAAMCSQLAEGMVEKVISLAGKLSLTESVFLLKKCRLIVSNDSAPTHLSLMANIPAITVYCSTVPEFGFYPYHSKSRYLSYNGLKCKPCGIHGHNKCPIGTFECAYRITPESIFGTIKDILS